MSASNRFSKIMPFDNTKYCFNITRAVQWHCAIGHTKILPALYQQIMKYATKMCAVCNIFRHQFVFADN